MSRMDNCQNVKNSKGEIMKITDIYNSAERKLLSYPEKIADFLKEKPVFPIALEIHLSERCNHRCPECQGKFAYD